MSLLQKAIPVTIANAASLSNAALLGDQVLVGIAMSAAWTAASLTFQVSFDDGVTWTDLYDDAGVEVKLSPTSPDGKYLALSPDPFGGVLWLKVRSGTTGTPVAQSAARSLTLVTRKLFPGR
jgi:hypothetical protein